MKIEVRCCCSTSLLGHANIDEPPIDSSVILGGLAFDYTTFKCKGQERGPALKSRDYLLDDLRRIPQFEPATFEERIKDAMDLL